MTTDELTGRIVEALQRGGFIYPDGMVETDARTIAFYGPVPDTVYVRVGPPRN